MCVVGSSGDFYFVVSVWILKIFKIIHVIVQNDEEQEDLTYEQVTEGRFSNDKSNAFCDLNGIWF